MDLVNCFDSLNLKGSGRHDSNREDSEDRPRSPIAHQKQSVYFSPVKPPSPRPVPTKCSSNANKLAYFSRYNDTPISSRTGRRSKRSILSKPIRRLLFPDSDGPHAEDISATPSLVVDERSLHNASHDSGVFDSERRDQSFEPAQASSGHVTNGDVLLSTSPRHLSDIFSFSNTTKATFSLKTTSSCRKCSASRYKSREKRQGNGSNTAQVRKPSLSDAAVQAEEVPGDSGIEGNLNVIQDKFLPAFECPVCYGHCIPPITQCRWGHVICNSCLFQLESSTCPVCRTSGPGTFVRSIALDSIANEMEFPCRFLELGCDKIGMSPSEKASHEAICSYSVQTTQL